jgi:hypothetical protein
MRRGVFVFSLRPALQEAYRESRNCKSADVFGTFSLLCPNWIMFAEPVAETVVKPVIRCLFGALLHNRWNVLSRGRKSTWKLPVLLQDDSIVDYGDGEMKLGGIRAGRRGALYGISRPGDVHSTYYLAGLGKMPRTL